MRLWLQSVLNMASAVVGHPPPHGRGSVTEPRASASGHSPIITTLCLVLTAMAASPAEIIDRIAVTVGKEVITESDVIRDLRISAMLDQKPVDLSGPEKRKAADRLVDQALILKEADFIRVA